MECSKKMLKVENDSSSNDVDLPDCPEDQVVSFNRFGQLVCVCKPGTYPLLDPSLQPDPGHRCFKKFDQGPCDSLESLDFDGFDHVTGPLLSCQGLRDLLSASDPIPFRACVPDKVFVLGKCRTPKKRV